MNLLCSHIAATMRIQGIRGDNTQQRRVKLARSAAVRMKHEPKVTSFAWGAGTHSRTCTGDLAENFANISGA